MSIFELWLVFTVVPGLSSIGGTSVVLCIIFMIVAVALCIGGLMVGELSIDKIKEVLLKLPIKSFVIFFAVSVSFAALIPSSDDMKYIVGGYVVTNADELEKLPDNLVGAANDFLESLKDDDKRESGSD